MSDLQVLFLCAGITCCCCLRNHVNVMVAPSHNLDRTPLTGGTFLILISVVGLGFLKDLIAIQLESYHLFILCIVHHLLAASPIMGYRNVVRMTMPVFVSTVKFWAVVLKAVCPISQVWKCLVLLQFSGCDCHYNVIVHVPFFIRCTMFLYDTVSKKDNIRHVHELAYSS